ncbi:ABC transporter substrate-binding protein [Methylobacterium sp. P1-11]|uniref:ABC transporter substrate-binding protein n=1 Tax=Methylobacterium sp. P1-11 TaxID=2024616 RepID=UPI0011EE5406|nr:ABC transporter substrate-binding protein [Methylobacterium sp. P1-11]KAA0113269.1 ABC transporter substrate-binding protein [Methylobacterium sp. P1-11]
MSWSENRRAFLGGLAGTAAATVVGGRAQAQSPGRSARTVRAVMHAPLALLDPVNTTAYITRNHGYLVYDVLFAMDSQSRPQPQMVQDWEVSDDRLTWTFRIRPGLRFHDGTPVTAADCVASLRRWAKRDLLGGRLLASTASFEATGAETMRLVLKEPFGHVLEALGKPGGPVPFIMPKRLADTPIEQRITEVVGSGPFRFVASEYRPGNKTVYERFDGYVPRSEPANGLAGGKVVNVDRVEWIEMPDVQTAVNALAVGEIDILENVPPDLIPQVKRQKDVTLVTRGSGGFLIMQLNWLNPPFDNLKIRQAVLHAVDQSDFLAAQIGDETLTQVCGSFYSCQSPYSTEVGAIQLGTPDIDGARALLREGGYKGEKVIILHPGDLPTGSALAPVAEQLLKSIGMNVEVATMDWASLLTRRSKQNPINQGGWSIAWGLWSSLDLMSPAVNLNLDGRGRAGYVGWAESEEIQRLRTAFLAESDLVKQKEIAAAIQKIAYDLVFSIPLGGYKQMTGHGPTVREVIADQILVFWNLEKSS